jgi:hypothetical protein
MMREELRLIDEQIAQLNQEMANLLSRHQDAVERLAEVPGLGVDSAQQIIADVGATAATFPSAKQLSSWVGAWPGEEESACVNYSHRSPNGTATCAGFSIRLPTLLSRLKELSLKLSIAVWPRASGINKLLEWLRIGSAALFGSSSTMEFVMKNGARRSPKNPSKGVPPR